MRGNILKTKCGISQYSSQPHNHLLGDFHTDTKMQIRNADSDDYDQLVDYMLWVQDLHIEALPDYYRCFDVNDAKSFLTKYSESKTSYIRVADNKGNIVGVSFIEFYELGETFLRKSRKFAYLDLLAVGSQYQRSGVGSNMLRDAKNVAKSHGVTRIELDVMGLNEPARRFYISQGFSELAHRMYFEESIA
jgi:ribosomal protein S18 acetylase RimI-like enzyme